MVTPAFRILASSRRMDNSRPSVSWKSSRPALMFVLALSVATPTRIHTFGCVHHTGRALRVCARWCRFVLRRENNAGPQSSPSTLSRRAKEGTRRSPSTLSRLATLVHFCACPPQGSARRQAGFVVHFVILYFSFCLGKNKCKDQKVHRRLCRGRPSTLSRLAMLCTLWFRCGLRDPVFSDCIMKNNRLQH